MEAFHEHRGKVLYIPVVVPDNWLLGVAHAMGVFAAILLFIAAASPSWSTLDLHINATSNYDADLNVVLTFGLRSFHIRFCEAHNASSDLVQFDSCGFEDVFYSSCSPNNQFCAERDDSTQSFVILILCGLGMLAVCGAALLRLGLLPSGFTVGAWMVLLCVFSFRQDDSSFVPGEIAQIWISSSVSLSQSLSWGYFVACGAVSTLGLAAVLATWGYLKTARSDQVLEEERRAENNGEGANVAGHEQSARSGVRRAAREAEDDPTTASHEF